MTLYHFRTLIISAVYLLSVCSTTAFAADTTGFSYDAQTGTLLGYTGTQKVLALPDNLGGTAITSLGEDLFSGQELSTVTIPASVTQISPETFAGKIRANIEVDPKNTAFSSENGMLYTKDRQTLLSVPTAVHANISVPDGTAIIAENAFQEVWLCDTVTLPASVSSIGSNAFAGSAVNTIVFEGNATQIAEDAFSSSTPSFLCMPRSDALYYALKHDIPYSLLSSESRFPYEITYLTVKGEQMLAGFRTAAPSGQAQWMLAGFNEDGALISCRILPLEEALSIPAGSFSDTTASVTAYIWEAGQMNPLAEPCSLIL